ncbi:hypothetical protein K492DRAFT_206727 [Lichtheimia hyalospora FSU 10163]|nr:hypothetical protein K492DRAFT_206727 [Lichtheimia hyalospora FSU 10163]
MHLYQLHDAIKFPPGFTIPIREKPITVIRKYHWTNTTTDATPHLKESVKQQLLLLNDRATVLAARAKFEAALDDATTMQAIAPACGMGYFRQGHVHQLQGRYGACIDICDQGLSAVPSSELYYGQLLHMRSIALKHYNSYVDFMEELPVDIIEIIVDMLFHDMKMEHLHQYLSISHQWRDKILKCSRELQLISTPSNDLFYRGNYILEHAGPYATKLTTKYEAKTGTLLFRYWKYPSLKFLDLDDYFGDFCRGSDVIAASVLDTLGAVQSTVTHMDIRLENIEYTVGDILKTFHHLISLTCHDINPDITTAPETYPTLKEFKLWNKNDRDGLQSEQLNRITQRFPALEMLSINPCVDTSALSTVQDNCPKLKLLAYNDYGNVELYMERITYKKIEKQARSGDNDNNDLQSLAVNFVIDDTFSVDMLDIITSMTRNSHSLQAINLCYNSKVDIRIYHPIYEHMTLSHLTSYIHKISCDEHIQLALCVISRSPHLKEIELRKGPRLTTDNEDEDDERSAYFSQDLSQIFVAMSCHPNLEIANIQVKGGDALAGVVHFLRYHNSIDSKLRTLSIPEHTDVPLDTLILLLGLPRLEDLTITIRMIISKDRFNDILAFLEKLARKCPLIHTLTLYEFHSLYLDALKLFPNLQSLCLKCENIYHPELSPLLLFPKLKDVEIQSEDSPEDMDDELRSELEKKINVLWSPYNL